MPFGERLDQYYRQIYAPAIKAAGLIPRRVDDLFRPSPIVHDIWRFIRNCEVVLADLTKKNANVFYELGLAHAIAKPVILVASSMADVPFDLRALRVLVYDKDEPKWGNTLRLRIIAAIREVLDSPRSAVLPSFLRDAEDVVHSSGEVESELVVALRGELEQMRGELEQRARTEPPSEDEAVNLVTRYVRGGLPDHVIVQRLAERRLPPSWILALIAQVRADSTRLADPAVLHPKSDKDP